LRAAGFFVPEGATYGESPHARRTVGLDRQEVIRVCVEDGVPIYQGKIDKYLFLMTQQHLAQQQQPAA
jgi:hypothetical protein